jgi:hypothetical protein
MDSHVNVHKHMLVDSKILIHAGGTETDKTADVGCTVFK